MEGSTLNDLQLQWGPQLPTPDVYCWSMSRDHTGEKSERSIQVARPGGQQWTLAVGLTPSKTRIEPAETEVKSPAGSDVDA